MTCQLDTHPRSEEISGWLRQGMTSTAINKLLGETFIPRVYSEHRTKCLGLAKLSAGRNGREFDQSNVEDIRDMETPSVSEVRDLALKIFWDRAKKNPSLISMKELATVIGSLSRSSAGGATGRSAVEEAMAGLDEVS